MDLSESMKSLLVKQQQQQSSSNPINFHMNPGQSSGSGSRAKNDPPGVGYVTEKLYMLIQLYLQNKGWNPSAELLQCFAELKDSPLLPNAAYLQVLASRLALDGQGRLVLRDTGKIVLPFEHFANAVMLKHMSGPHGLHLSLEATLRAVIDSYSIGRDNFGMEKEFILEVVNSCPNPACRYYKSHLNPFDAAPAAGPSAASATTTGSSASAPNLSLEMVSDLAKSSQLLKQQQQQHQAAQQQMKGQHHLTNVLMQQNRALAAQQSLEKFNNLSALEKQRMLAAMCPPNQGQSNGSTNSNPLANLMTNPPSNNPLLPGNLIAGLGPAAAVPPPPAMPNVQGGGSPVAAMKQAQQLAAGASNLPPNPNLNLLGGGGANNTVTSTVNNTPTNLLGVNAEQQRRQQQEQLLQKQMLMNLSSAVAQNPGNVLNPLDVHSMKITEYMRSAAEASSGSGSSTPNLESMTPTNKDLLALHNGAWNNNCPGANNSAAEYRDGMFVGQDKIVRVFSELMRNMAKMKTFIRPAMCKPYGKQSESLQKSLLDTIQLVQSLRNCLPASHIPVNSWKSEDRQFRPEVGGNFEGC